MPEQWPEGMVWRFQPREKDIAAIGGIKRLEQIANATYELGNETIVNNARHADALTKSSEALQTVLEGLTNDIPSDLVALDIRKWAVHHLGLNHRRSHQRRSARVRYLGGFVLESNYYKTNI